ncbi:glycosyltransferase family 4 protein [Marinobacter sp. CA1]|uniref:glycosyltransferase family 4 protein n=1 Tax=Marinobacter sp. CA1 TaxID=2817656 RepID=UPI001D082B08|nr:glycosyltransferase family 4 protein [Marinobacter sp. CA1]UDL04444.1 glycosyltransferase family 4 protein [Marinobacter sp. CA1]
MMPSPQLGHLRLLFIKTRLDAAEFDLIRRLHELGLTLKVICQPQGDHQRQFLQEQDLLIEPRRRRGKLDPLFIRQIRGIIRQHNINLIHATDSTSLANAIWASYFTGVRLIGYRGTSARIRKSDPTYWLGILHPKVKLILCVSRSVYDYMKTVVEESRLRLNYKGFDANWVDPRAPLPDAFPVDPKQHFVGLFMGNSKGRPHKGLEVLIQAFHQVSDLNSVLVVLGNFSQEAANLAKQGPNRERIYLMGEQIDAVQWLAQADLYVQPSLQEGLPRSVKEAMALSLPIIITDIPGPTELVEHGSSALAVPANQAEPLARAWDRLAADPALRRQLGRNARTRLDQNFSARCFVDNTIMAYLDVLPPES